MDTKELSQKFILQDILGYFFPGLIGAIAIAALFYIQPGNGIGHSEYLKSEYSLVVIVLLLSLPFGIVLSGPSWLITFIFKKLLKLKRHRKYLPLQELDKDSLDSYNILFGVNETEWSDKNFYFARTVVYEYMPMAAAYAARQNSLRMFRQYMISPVLIWAYVGVEYGIVTSNVLYSSIVTLIITTTIILVNLYRMQKNEIRETREVLTAFISGVRLGHIKDGIQKQKTT